MLFPIAFHARYMPAGGCSVDTSMLNIAQYALACRHAEMIVACSAALNVVASASSLYGLVDEVESPSKSRKIIDGAVGLLCSSGSPLAASVYVDPAGPPS